MLRRLLITSLCLIISMASTLYAIDNATVFPPVTKENSECGNDQLRVISWAKGANSTICLTGQEVLTLAIPTCAANQQVVYDGSKYICRSPKTIPTCTSGQYLSFNGSDYECKSNTPPPTCSASQVLTYDGSSYVCTERNDNIPVCTADQFLTYNGSSYQCASTKKQNFEISTQEVTCPVGYYGASDNSWGCVAACPSGTYVTGGGFNASAAYTSGGHYSMMSGNGWICNIGHIDGCTGGLDLPCASTCSALCSKIIQH